MWLHVDSRDYQAARVGVAVAASPTGPFVYRGSVRPHGEESRDMAVFEDPQHSGVAWLVYSSENNRVTHVGALDSDYTAVSVKEAEETGQRNRMRSLRTTVSKKVRRVVSERETVVERPWVHTKCSVMEEET
jgi:hypothetical protein